VISTINGDSMCRSTRSLRTKACGPKMLRSWPSVLRRTSCAACTSLCRSPCGVELLSKRRYATEQTVRVKFKAYCRRTTCRMATSGHGRSDRSRLFRRVYLEASRRESRSSEVDKVRKAVYGSKFLAPGGEIMMDAANHHTHRPVLIVRSWRTASSRWSPVRRAGEAGTLERIYEPGQGCDWSGIKERIKKLSHHEKRGYSVALST